MIDQRDFPSFQTQEQALEHIERARWGDTPVCPYCNGTRVSRHASPDRKIPRLQCHDCKRAYAVTAKTIFQGTQVSLPQWFLILKVLFSGRRRLSAQKISSDTGIRRATVWNLMKKIEQAMRDKNSPDAAFLLSLSQPIPTTAHNSARNKATQLTQANEESLVDAWTLSAPLFSTIAHMFAWFEGALSSQVRHDNKTYVYVSPVGTLA